jgi:phage shock protein PspC (stress-responsive transcriptional regulator)
MIQSIKINLNKTTFTLNNEAYSLLNDYVRALKECFKQEPEIIQDIEARIAELLTIELEATQSEFVSEKEVQKVIGAVGSIEELAKSFRNENKNEYTQFNEKHYATDKQRPKLRRSVFNQNLGGVCSGLAYYLNVDVSFIRIAFVFTFLFFGTGILAYLILWVVIPRAKNEEIDLIIAHENNYSNRLYRSRDTKAIGGVCSALALHFGIEIWIVRLAFVVSVVFWGSGILIYLISWIIIPKASGITANFQSERKQDQIIENENQVAIIKNIFLGLIAVLGVGMIGLLIVFFFFSAGVFSFFDNSNLYEFLKMALPFDEGFKGLIVGIGLCIFVPILMLLVFVLKFIFKANISFRYAGSGLVLLFFVGIGLIVYGSIVSLPNKIEFRDNKKLTEQNINKNDSIYFIFNEINTGKMVDNFQFNEA